MKMSKEKLGHFPVGTTALVWTIILHMDQKSLEDLKLSLGQHASSPWWQQQQQQMGFSLQILFQAP